MVLDDFFSSAPPGICASRTLEMPFNVCLTRDEGHIVEVVDLGPKR